MDGDFHFDSHRRPVKQCWLILPLQYRLQCGGYEQRMAAERVCLYYVSPFIDHRSDHHNTPDVCLPREFRILGLDRIDLPRRFEVGANAKNSLRSWLLRG